MSRDLNKVTIRDISNAAGVAYSTVSTILSGNQKNYLSEKTKARVLAIAKEMKYIPSYANQILKGKSTKTVALLVSSPTMAEQEHIRQLIFTLTQKLKMNGYASYVSYFLPEEDRSLELRKLIQRGCDAFFFVSGLINPEEIFKEISGSGKTYFTFGNFSNRYVEQDLAWGVNQVLEDFISQGRPNFKLLLIKNGLSDKNRFDGLSQLFPMMTRKELMERYVFVDEEITFNPTKFDFERIYKSGYQLTKRALEQDSKTQALFYQSDYFAAGGLRALSEMGLMPMKDIAIAGVNNTLLSQIGNPPFTSIGLDIEKTTDTVMKNLFQEGDFSEVHKPLLYFRNL